MNLYEIHRDGRTLAAGLNAYDVMRRMDEFTCACPEPEAGIRVPCQGMKCDGSLHRAGAPTIHDAATGERVSHAWVMGEADARTLGII